MQYENIANWFTGWGRTEIQSLSARERNYWNERAVTNITKVNERTSGR